MYLHYRFVAFQVLAFHALAVAFHVLAILRVYKLLGVFCFFVFSSLCGCLMQEEDKFCLK